MVEGQAHTGQRKLMMFLFCQGRMNPSRAGQNHSGPHRRVLTLLLLIQIILANTAPRDPPFQSCSSSRVEMLQNSFKYYCHTHFRSEATEVQGRAAACPKACSRSCSGQSDPGRVTPEAESFTSWQHCLPSPCVPHASFSPPH